MKNMAATLLTGHRHGGECAVSSDKLKFALQKQDFRIDEQEQYSRRDNLVVHGLEESQQFGPENTNAAVIAVAAEIGVALTDADISTSYRLGRRGAGGKPRPVVVWFVRRDTRTEMLRRKGRLRGHATLGRVYLGEQLSPFRAKLLHAVNNDTDIARSWTIDGRVYCTRQVDQDGRRCVLSSPEDLFKQLGWGEEKLKKSGLFIKL